MDRESRQGSESVVRVGGWSLIAAAVGFVGVFSWLAARFNYPDVLDGSAAEVLPKLLELGSTGRAVWVVYALIPFLLIPAAMGVVAAFRMWAPNAMRMAMVFAVIAAVSMFLGLARWPTLHWSLATAWTTAGPEARVAINSVFMGTNQYLGQFIGEFVGEVALSGFFLATGMVLRQAEARGARSVGYLGIGVSVIGLVAALRNVTESVAPIAAVNNLLLPVWLVVLGVYLIRRGF